MFPRDKKLERKFIGEVIKFVWGVFVTVSLIYLLAG